ncbi:MAG: sigma-70 family RNA polymerase sigma factor [Nitrospirota bacterium]
MIEAKPIDDTEWMRRFQSGDEAAFERLFEKYHRPIISFCFRFLGDKEQSEEIAQETFLQVYRFAEGYRPLAKFSTWLYTIAKNLCLNRLRKKDPTLNCDLNNEDSQGNYLEETIADLAPTPDHEYSQKQLSEIVQKAVGNLSASLRAPLILYRYQELSHQEIAEILGCTVTAVKLRLHRAIRVLEKELAPYMRE